MSFLLGVLASPLKIITSKSNLVVALDNSSSTVGKILQTEVAIAKKFSDQFEKKTFLVWNNTATVCDSLDNLVARGGTNPNRFVDLMKKKRTFVDFLVLITDGQIENIDEFRKNLCSLDLQCPIIVILTFESPLITLQNTCGCNMSIADACLSASSNVAVCVADSPENVRIIEAKGFFTQFVKHDTSCDITLVPVQTFSEFKVDEFLGEQKLTMKLLPGYIVQCPDDFFIDVEKLIAHLRNTDFVSHQEELAYALEQVVLRKNLPTLNVDVMIQAVQSLKRSVERFTVGFDLATMQKRLFAHIASEDAEKADQVRQDIVTAKKSTKQNTVSGRLLRAIDNSMYVLTAYKRYKGFFYYEEVPEVKVSQKELVKSANCVQGECPITMENDSLGIFFVAPQPALLYAKKKPRKTNGPLTAAERKSVSKYYTRRVMRHSPSLCGAAMLDALTPGLFGARFAKSELVHLVNGHPLLGYLPLSFDIRVFVQQLSAIFTYPHSAPSLLYGYVSMVAAHLEKNMASPLLREHAKFVLENLISYCRFVGCRCTLDKSIQFILAHPVCLHHISYSDALSMVCIAKQLMPEFKFDEQTVLAIINFVYTFQQVRDRYILFQQARRDPLCIFQECFDANGVPRNTLYCKIACAFGEIHQQFGHVLRRMKFKACLAYFLSACRQPMRDMYCGKLRPDQVADYVPLIPEIPSNNPHFDSNIWKETYRQIFHGQDVVPAATLSYYQTITNTVSRIFYGEPCKFECQFCCAKFATVAEKNAHIKKELGCFDLDLVRLLRYNRNALTKKNWLQDFQKRFGADQLVIYSPWIRQQVETLQTIITSQ